MLKATLTLLAIVLYLGASGQIRVFPEYGNGLMYPDTSISCLCNIVDSLHRLYKKAVQTLPDYMARQIDIDL